MRNYPFPNTDTKICASVGYPNKTTKAPLMHNAGFDELAINAIYLGLSVPRVADAISSMKSLNFCGFSIGMPHKQEVIKYLDEVDEAVSEIGACNTVHNVEGVLKGYNSDWIGALEPIKQRMDMKDKVAIVMGAGGTARAITYGLKRNGAKVVILNRTLKKAKDLAMEFKVDFGDINDPEAYKKYDILINATPVGSRGAEDCDCRLCRFLGLGKLGHLDSLDSNLMFEEEKLALDVVFQRNETEFTKAAKERNFNVIHGHEMLVEQGAFQFELFTGVKAPKDVMYSALKRYLE